MGQVRDPKSLGSKFTVTSNDDFGYCPGRDGVSDRFTGRSVDTSAGTSPHTRNVYGNVGVVY